MTTKKPLFLFDRLRGNLNKSLISNTSHQASQVTEAFSAFLRTKRTISESCVTPEILCSGWKEDLNIFMILFKGTACSIYLLADME